jgi:ryanodine receptor 2
MNDSNRILSRNAVSSSGDTYVPSPIPTYGIDLPGSLLDMIEVLAEHNHEVWAEQRIRDGWMHGTHRDDDQKTHPCLVRYGDLPEEEKDYDRNTAIGVLKVVIKLGYRIEKG